MKNEKEEWIDDMMSSVKGINRAQPSYELFSKIEVTLKEETAQIISLNFVRLNACAGILLLVLNLFVILSYSTNGLAQEKTIAVDYNPSSLVSDYKIYE